MGVVTELIIVEAVEHGFGKRKKETEGNVGKILGFRRREAANKESFG